jgi:hypothetical protein
MGKKKKALPFHVDGNSPPPLLKALDRFEGGSKELGQFFLGLPQVSSYAGKLAVSHRVDSS